MKTIGWTRWAAVCVVAAIAFLVGSALFRQSPAVAQNLTSRRIKMIAGPLNIARGEVSRSCIYLPAVQNVREAANFQLVLTDRNGNILGRQSFSALPGTWKTFDVACLGDGSVRIFGQETNLSVQSSLGIIAILIGYLPAGSATPTATAQGFGFNEIRDGTSNTLLLTDSRFLLPYIEQDNLR